MDGTPATTRFRYVEVCAGAGGMGLGLHRAGWSGTGMELDADAVATHNANVGPCLLADVTTAAAPHGADLAVGGVPCPSFSYAGEGLGLDDPRGQLFRSLLRIGAEAGARCILMENVRGLVSCGALPVILSAFHAAGYSTAHALLCAADYDVPQNRVRLIIVGFRDTEDLARFQWPRPSRAAPGNLQRLPPHRTMREALGLPRSAVADMLDRPSATVSTGDGCAAFASATYRKKLAAWLADAGVDATCFTVAQCAALQTFPASFVFSGTTESQHRQVGNAVPVEFAVALGRSVAAALYG